MHGGGVGLCSTVRLKWGFEGLALFFLVCCREGREVIGRLLEDGYGLSCGPVCKPFFPRSE